MSLPSHEFRSDVRPSVQAAQVAAATGRRWRPAVCFAGPAEEEVEGSISPSYDRPSPQQSLDLPAPSARAAAPAPSAAPLQDPGVVGPPSLPFSQTLSPSIRQPITPQTNPNFRPPKMNSPRKTPTSANLGAWSGNASRVRRATAGAPNWPATVQLPRPWMLSPLPPTTNSRPWPN